MTALRPRVHRDASRLKQPDHPSADSMQHLPHAFELALPALETLSRIKSLVEWCVISLSAHLHALVQSLVGVVMPALTFAAVFTSTLAYRLLLISLAGGNSAMGLLRVLMRSASKRILSAQLRKNIELELYSFLLGPGMVFFKVVFWVGFWGFLGAVVSGPLWLPPST